MTSSDYVACFALVLSIVALVLNNKRVRDIRKAEAARDREKRIQNAMDRYEKRLRLVSIAASAGGSGHLYDGIRCLLTSGVHVFCCDAEEVKDVVVGLQAIGQKPIEEEVWERLLKNLPAERLLCVLKELSARHHLAALAGKSEKQPRVDYLMQEIRTILRPEDVK